MNDAPAPELAVEVGYAILAGHYASTGGASDDPMTKGTVVGGMIGWRFTPRLSLGAWADFTAGSPATSDATCGGGGCSAHVVHVGAQMAWRIVPSARFDPWLALGVGYGWAIVDYPGTLNLDGSTAVPAGSLIAQSPVVARVEAGGEVALDPSFAVGPWIALTVEKTATGEGGEGHAWLALGVRGSFTP